MAVGTISTHILTDIANAIRYQAGVATLYKPGQMAAAVAALDGTDAGQYQAQPYMQLESGILSESVFSDIAALYVFFHFLQNVAAEFFRTQAGFCLPAENLADGNTVFAPVTTAVGVVEQEGLEVVHGMGELRFRCFVCFEFLKQGSQFVTLIVRQ